MACFELRQLDQFSGATVQLLPDVSNGFSSEFGMEVA